MKKYFNLIIMGPQGSGKGTQAELLAKKFDMEIVAPGNLIREMIKKHTILSQKIKNYLKKGELLPDKYIKKLVLEKINIIKKNQGIIFDGFPRNFNQTQILDELSGQLNLKKPIMIYLKIDRKTAITRIVSRRICPKCGKIFFPGSKNYRQGICSKCGIKLVQREDDRPEVVKTRLQIYFKETQKIIKYYRQTGRFIEVDGEPNIEQVFEKILEKINDYFKE